MLRWLHRAFTTRRWLLGQLLCVVVSFVHLEQVHSIDHRKGCDADCYEFGTCNEEVGRCDCPKHLSGDNCKQPASLEQMRLYGLTPGSNVFPDFPCLNDCNKRGKCIAGWCHCERDFWGADCSLSFGYNDKPTLLTGTGYRPREKRPLIYVYDIPPKWSSWHNPYRIDRALHWVFWQRLLGSGAQIADGDAADLYFIPIKMRSISDGNRLLEVIDYIRRYWPWWDRKRGYRHFVIHTGDAGRGEVTATVRRITANMTWLHHFGLMQDYDFSGWKKAHRPGKDIVVPIYFGGRQGHGTVPLSFLHPHAPRWERPNALLFAGRICGDNSQPEPGKGWPHCKSKRNMGYSQGVRQEVHWYHHNRTGYKIVTSDPNYLLDLTTYKFCLAPTGAGHGHRQVLVATMACLPVLIGDHVMQPFEPEMDYTQFGLKVSQADIPNLHNILAAITPEQYLAMQDSARCAMQHLIFSSMSGSFMHETGKYDAFEMTLEILRMIYKHPTADPADYVRIDQDFRTFVNCGERDMRTYGKRMREQHFKELSAKASDNTPHEATVTMPQGGIVALAARRAGEALSRHGGPGVPVPLPLCSMSEWDPMAWRCGSLARMRNRTHSFAPGGQYCAAAPDLGKCPRAWL